MRNQIDTLSLNSKFWPIVILVILSTFVFSAKDGLSQETQNSYRPDWTFQTTFQENGKIYFTGGFMNGADYSLSIRCANAEAIKIAAQSISTYIRSVFSLYTHGTNSNDDGIERYVEDGIATLTNNLHVQGLRQKQVYHEAVTNGGRPSYNAFVLLEITDEDYKNAKIGVLQSLKEDFEKVHHTEAKQKAEQLLEELTEGT
jgi:hypothetical protein